MHPLDTLATLDLARHDHDRRQTLREAAQRHAIRDAVATRLRGRRHPPRNP
jgi:hypothetical protein